MSVQSFLPPIQFYVLLGISATLLSIVVSLKNKLHWVQYVVCVGMWVHIVVYVLWSAYPCFDQILSDPFVMTNLIIHEVLVIFAGAVIHGGAGMLRVRLDITIGSGK